MTQIFTSKKLVVGATRQSLGKQIFQRGEDPYAKNVTLQKFAELESVIFAEKSDPLHLSIALVPPPARTVYPIPKWKELALVVKRPNYSRMDFRGMEIYARNVITRKRKSIELARVVTKKRSTPNTEEGMSIVKIVKTKESRKRYNAESVV